MGRMCCILVRSPGPRCVDVCGRDVHCKRVLSRHAAMLYGSECHWSVYKWVPHWHLHPQDFHRSLYVYDVQYYRLL
jgi:hypothetical protein